MNYNVFASYDRLGQSLSNYAKDNAPTLKCPSTTENYGGSYRLKAGLITADELVLAGESMMVTGNSYLNPGDSGIDYWTMTPADFFNGFAGVDGGFETLGSAYVAGIFAARPVINVTTDNGFTSGDGTVSNPYVLS